MQQFVQTNMHMQNPIRAVNSAVECHLHTVEATGSIPVSPTKLLSGNVRYHTKTRMLIGIAGFLLLDKQIVL